MIAAQMAAMGLWPQAFSGKAAVKAAGTTAADAAVAPLSAVTVVSGGTGGVILAGGGTLGDTMLLVNATAAAVNAYPATGGKINNATAALSVGIAHAVTLLCLAAGQWFVLADVALTGTIPTDEEVPADAPAPAPAPAPGP